MSVAPVSATTNVDKEEEAQQVLAKYKQLRAYVSEVATKINEMDGDRNEHSLVIKAIEKLDPNRRCYRSIGGVLVERTVAEVLPAVQKNLQGIEDVIKQLTESLKEKEKEAEEYREKYNIRLAGEELFDTKDNKSDRTGGSVLA